jgi:hypothetical protein
LRKFRRASKIRHMKNLIAIFSFVFLFHSIPVLAGNDCREQKLAMAETFSPKEIKNEIQSFNKYLSYLTAADVQLLEKNKNATTPVDPEMPETPLSDLQTKLLNELTERSGLFPLEYHTVNYQIDLGLGMTGEDVPEFTFEIMSRNFTDFSPAAPLTNLILQYRYVVESNKYDIYVCADTNAQVCEYASILRARGKSQKQYLRRVVYFSMSEFINSQMPSCDRSTEIDALVDHTPKN